MKIKLEKLTIKNYRCIKSASFEFRGIRHAIEGENGKGKTSTLEAIYWLLTGDLLKGGNSNSLKPLNAPIETIVEVKGVFSFENKQVEIIRQLEPNVKEEELVGNTTKTFLNGIAYDKQKDFIFEFERLLGISDLNTDLDIVKLCIDPLYLAEKCESTDWQLVRKFVEQLATNKGLNIATDIGLLKADLERYEFDIEKVKKYYRSSIKTFSLQEASEKGKVEYLESLPRISDEKKADADLLLKEANKSNTDTEADALKTDILKLENKIEKLDDEIKDKSDRLDYLNEHRRALLKQIKEFKPISECPTCHHKLSEEERTSIADKVKADLIAQGKTEKKEREQLETDIESLLTDCHNLTDLLNTKNDDLNALLSREKVKDDILPNLAELNRIVADYERQKENDEKLAELKSKVQLLSKERLSFEQKLEAAKSYYIKQADLLDKAQADLFGRKYFSFIKQNINGNFEPICKLIYDEKVPYASCSQSEKIRLGIDLIESLRKLIDLPILPILFDEGGEISKDTFSKIKTDAQIICVRVSDDEEMKIISL